jgi:hypothetical protein
MPFEIQESVSAAQTQPSALQEEWFRTPVPEARTPSPEARTQTPPATAPSLEAPRATTSVEQGQPTARDATADGSERPAPAARAEGEKTQWTVAINLAANGTFNAENLGADAQWRRLQQLAEQTKGTPVDLVVQLTQGEARGKHASTGNGASVQRYLVSNGQIRQIHDGPSRGMAGDVTDLLRAANEVSPSQQLALIQQSHGAGTDGVEGAAGSATLPEFSAAIKAGLEGSNHERLDLIDFNACSMGATSVVDQMSRVANHMVASSEVELGAPDGAYDGQNIQHTLSQLLKNPNVTPSEFARNMVMQAAQGHNDGFNSASNERGSGTPTLSHYDLQRLPEFNNSMNRFGEELAAAVSENPTNIAAIDRAIEGATVLPRNGTTMGGAPNENRDLTNFANNVINEIDSEKITDADGSLREAARHMLATQRVLQPEYHGSAEGGYDKLGGLNAFLPDLELRDPARDASPNINPVDQILQQTENDNSFATMKHRDVVVHNITEELADVERLIGSAHPEALENLRQDLEAVKRATNEEQFRTALNAMNARTKTLNEGQLGVDIDAAARREVRDRYFRNEAIASMPGWQSFMESLRMARP